jgi:putative ABC transport system permease protein
MAMSAVAVDLPRSRLRSGDVVGLGLLGLRVKRTRALLTGLGIAIGIAAMVAVVGISASSKADLLAELDALGTNFLQVQAGDSVFGEAAELPTTAPDMIHRMAHVESGSATRTVDNATVRRNSHIPASGSGGIAVVATEPGLLDTLLGTVDQGTFLNEATGAYPSVVLGSVAGERLGISSLDGGPLVYLGGQWF